MTGGGGSTPPLPPEAVRYYLAGREAERLYRGHGSLELERTRELILRHLPGRPRRIVDVGGGPGVHACWLAGLGHEVHLVDALALHAEQARAASASQPRHPVRSIRLGDARHLDLRDGSVAAVLLFGPLYHLTGRVERLTALREAHRVLEPGGLLFAAGVSRFASLLSGLFEGALADPDYRRIVERDLQDGQHRNPTDRPYFTTAFFHHPDELVSEIRDAGFDILETTGVEGAGWLLPDLEARWSDPAWRTRIIDAARAIEHEPSLLGLSAHVLVVAKTP